MNDWKRPRPDEGSTAHATARLEPTTGAKFDRGEDDGSDDVMLLGGRTILSRMDRVQTMLQDLLECVLSASSVYMDVQLFKARLRGAPSRAEDGLRDVELWSDLEAKLERAQKEWHKVSASVRRLSPEDDETVATIQENARAFGSTFSSARDLVAKALAEIEGAHVEEMRFNLLRGATSMVNQADGIYLSARQRATDCVAELNTILNTIFAQQEYAQRVAAATARDPVPIRREDDAGRGIGRTDQGGPARKKLSDPPPPPPMMSRSPHQTIDRGRGG